MPTTNKRGGSKTREEIANPVQKTRFKEIVANLVFKGQDPTTIAKALHPDDKEAYRATRQALWYMAETDEEFATIMGRRAHARMVLALPKAAAALAKRAERGRPDAIKLLFEATGFHNPRIKHEHTGDIAITLNLPRPERPALAPTEEPTNGEPVVDADVVEEDESSDHEIPANGKD